MYSKICPQCQKQFTSEWNKTKFCSDGCYREYSKTGHTIKCLNCGTEKYLKPARIERGEKFCSRACQNAYLSVTKTCPVCKKEFSVLKALAHRYTVCSRACRLASTVYKPCLRCGKVFRATPTHDGKIQHNYCSEACYRPVRMIECEYCHKAMREGPLSKRKFCCQSCYRKSVGETTTEKTVRLVLEDLGIEYLQEEAIGRYSVDFFLKNLNIVLEVDGDYWHRNPERDARKTSYLEACGYKVVRIKESELTATDNISGLVVAALDRAS